MDRAGVVREVFRDFPAAALKTNISAKAESAARRGELPMIETRSLRRLLPAARHGDAARRVPARSCEVEAELKAAANGGSPLEAASASWPRPRGGHQANTAWSVRAVPGSPSGPCAGLMTSAAFSARRPPNRRPMSRRTFGSRSSVSGSTVRHRTTSAQGIEPRRSRRRCAVPRPPTGARRVHRRHR